MPSLLPRNTDNLPIGTLALLNLSVAVLYASGGWLGLLIAAPPGYATIIWPPSGIAVAALLFYGPQLSPGVFLGSFVVNCIVGGAVSGAGIDPAAMLVPSVIALGSTAQALVGAGVVRRVFGRPVRLESAGSVLTLALITGPATCLIAATVGAGTLFVVGTIDGNALWPIWLTWWTGDLLGVLVFLPLALLSPWRPWTLKWRGEEMAGFSTTTLLTVLLPLVTTFYSWIIVSDIIHERNNSAFASLVEDSEHALLNRLAAYKQSLDGGAGAFHASDKLTLQDWRRYVETLDIHGNLPGINGIGFIEPVAEDDLAAYPRRAAGDGVTALKVHPQGEAFDHFIIKYIEPFEPNKEAVGLNIGFERNRYDAAVQARDTGRATITKRIFLVQDETRSAGFLLLRPLYAQVEDPGSVDARRRSFRGWVYAPFVASRFLNGLTATQGQTIDISVFDGAASDPDQLIYSSLDADRSGFRPAFTVRQSFPVMEQIWTVEWQSTPAFEQQVKSAEPMLVLFGGIILTGLLGGLLLTLSRREEAIRRLVDVKTQQLVASEQRTRSLVETAMVAILLLDEDGTVISANQACEDIFAFSTDQIVGSTFGELIQSPGYHSEALEELARTEFSATSREQRTPLLMRDRTGDDLYLDIQLNSWAGSNGAKRYTVIIRNVTREIQAHIALENTERRWKYALEGSDIGVFDIDLKRGSSVVSAKWMEMLGFDPADDIKPQSEWEARVHPEDMPAVMAADAECLSGETERSVSEYRLRTKSGQWIWARSDAAVVERDEDGQPTRLIGTQTDITELKRAAAALQASEERFRTAIEHAPVGMAMLSLDRKWIKVNASLCSMLGYPEDELMATNPSEVIFLDEDGNGEDRMADLTAGRAKTYRNEVRLPRKNGSQVWVMISISVAADTEEDQRYFIVQIQDITEHKEMERLKTEFVSTVSHELRTPLTSIRASLGLVLGSMAQALPQNAERLITIAHSNCERLVLLINDILDLEKISSGQMRFDFRREVVGDLLEQAIEANQGYADQYGVTLELEEPIPDCLFNVDPARFHQVLANLISNAAKFSEKGGVVKVHARMTDKGISIAVTDHGQGIPVEFRSKIFGRFSTADASSSRKNPGTGLGLNISRQIVERMGGTIDFKSTPGVRTTFWVTLPVEQAETQPAADAPRIRDASLPMILHVEDDRDFCEVVAAYLEDKAQVTATPSLRGARSRLARGTFDLAILDADLAQGNGLDLIDELHALGTPVIVLSAREDLPRDERVICYLSKSRVTESQFVAIVMDAVAAQLSGAGRKQLMGA